MNVRSESSRSVLPGGVAPAEATLAADRRCWAHRLLACLGELPVTVTSQRNLTAALAEQFSAAADEIDHRTGLEASHASPAAAGSNWPRLRFERHPQSGSGSTRRLHTHLP